jgi:hypothetical protein
MCCSASASTRRWNHGIKECSRTSGISTIHEIQCSYSWLWKSQLRSLARSSLSTVQGQVKSISPGSPKFLVPALKSGLSPRTYPRIHWNGILYSDLEFFGRREFWKKDFWHSWWCKVGIWLPHRLPCPLPNPTNLNIVQLVDSNGGKHNPYNIQSVEHRIDILEDSDQGRGQHGGR